MAKSEWKAATRAPGGTYEDAGGAEGKRLEHVGAAPDAAVEVHRDAPLRRHHDLQFHGNSFVIV
jgi:hypothetical protein